MANTQTAVKSKTNKLLLLVLSALFAAMITVMTAFLFHIRSGSTAAISTLGMR